jgi:hypothetical protein
VAKLTSIVLTGANAQIVALTAQEYLRDLQFTIMQNDHLFLSPLDLLQGTFNIDGGKLLDLTNKWLGGGLEALRGDLGPLAGLEFGVIDQPELSIAKILGVVDPAFQDYEINYFADADSFMANALPQDSQRFKFCSRVAGKDRFVYRKRA